MSKINLKTGYKIDFDDWKEIDSCECGGPIFKIHNSSKNIYIAKCGHTKDTLEIEPKSKRKVWVKSKKQPCKFLAYHQGPKSVFYKKTEIKNHFVMENPHILLHNQLKSLFDYLFIEEKYTFLQEIDIIVKNKLYRTPRDPTKETLREYHDRIFSMEIFDKSSDYNPLLNYKTIEEDIELSETEEPDDEEEQDEELEDELEDESIATEEISETEDIEVDTEQYDDYDEKEDYGDYD
jgi:hypothetical protein